jgi:hypothetical protein
MPWTFQQSTGLVSDQNGKPCGCSYAGRGEGKNNPVLQDVRAGCRLSQGEWVPVDGLTPDDWGPLPCGLYVMQSPVDTTTHGPYVIWLTPDEANEMFGRSGFGWHGDSLENPGLASEGCICSPRTLRNSGWASPDHQLQVIP